MIETKLKSSKAVRFFLSYQFYEYEIGKNAHYSN